VFYELFDDELDVPAPAADAVRDQVRSVRLPVASTAP
jgi:hypothetical protein